MKIKIKNIIISTAINTILIAILKSLNQYNAMSYFIGAISFMTFEIICYGKDK